jgi:hypothetical protein
LSAMSGCALSTMPNRPTAFTDVLFSSEWAVARLRLRVIGPVNDTVNKNIYSYDTNSNVVRHIICLQILQLTTQTIYINKIQKFTLHSSHSLVSHYRLQIQSYRSLTKEGNVLTQQAFPCLLPTSPNKQGRKWRVPESFL